MSAVNEIVKHTGTPFVRVEKQNERVMPGSWWLIKNDQWLNIGYGDNARPVSAGTYVLCKKGDFVDGIAHSVTLGVPPGLLSDEEVKRQSNMSWTVLVKELLENAEMRPEAEALASRQAEIDQINQKIADKNKDIMQIQTELASLSAMSSNSGVAMISSDNDGLTQETRVSNAVERQREISKRSEDIAKSSTEIAKTADEIQTNTLKVSAYYSERATAAMAAVQPVQIIASRLGEYVDTLGLYVGNKIDAQLVADGKGAAQDEKLFIFQRIIYMDEEFLVHLMDGGATHADMPAFFDKLSKDKKLADRIFGGQRSVVLMKPRRTEKSIKYDSELYTIQQAMQIVAANIEEKERNKTLFMAIRDGDKFWHVSLPDILQNTERFFPTPDDLEAPYRERRWYKDDPIKKIGQDNIKYAKAVEDFRVMALNYERLLLILWGLHDRLHIFGDFAIGDQRNFSNPEFQNDHIKLVMDDQDLLGSNRPDWKTYVKEQNEKLTKKSRVVCVWKELVNSETAPKWVELTKNYDQHHNVAFDPKISIETISELAGKFTVKAPAIREVFDSNEGFYKEKRFKISVPLNSGNSSNISYLVIDDIDYEDIEYYINSRGERETYIGYIAAMFLARDLLKAEAEEDYPSAQALMNLPGITEKNAKSACRKWRALYRGEKAPSPNDNKFVELERIARSETLDLSVFNENISEMVLEKIETLGYKPLALTRTPKGDNFCYFADENSDEIKKYKEYIGCWPYISKAEVEFNDGDINLKNIKEISNSRSMLPGEVVIEQYNEFNDIKFNISRPTTLRKNLDNVISFFGNKTLFLGFPTGGVAKEMLYSDIIELMLSEGRYVNHQLYSTPIGFINTKRDEQDVIDVIMLGCDTLNLMSSFDETRRDVRRLIEATHHSDSVNSSVLKVTNLTKPMFKLVFYPLKNFSDELVKSSKKWNGIFYGRRTDLKDLPKISVEEFGDASLACLTSNKISKNPYYMLKRANHVWIDHDMVKTISERFDIKPYQEPYENITPAA